MEHGHEKLGFDKRKFQVFLFVCPGNIPFFFALHPWFVINEYGALSRWEVLFRKTEREGTWSHLSENNFPPFQGIEVLPFVGKYVWRGKLLGKIEGEEAQQMASFIKNSPNTYPYTQKYILTGPNSNTYAAWVLNAFPEFRVELPWNTFGKGFASRIATSVRQRDE